MTKETSRSGPSGKHRGPRYLLTLESAEQRKRWEKAAAATAGGLSLASWMRLVCDSASGAKMINVYAPVLLSGKAPRRKA